MQITNTMPDFSPTKLDMELISLALEKSPTGGNSKPFYWQWTENKLIIQHDVKLAEHYLNPNQHASWIALGCMIQSVEIAAQFQGFKSQVQIRDDLKTEISFSRSMETPDRHSSYENLMLRTTYRGALQASEAPHIAKATQKGIQVRLVAAQSLSQDLKNYLISTDTYLWLQKKAMLSFFNEVRFFDHRLQPRGIRSEDLGIGYMDQLMLYFFSFVPWLMSLMVRIPGFNQSFKNASKRSLKNAHFILITSDQLDPMSLVRAGQEALSTWVRIQEQGYGAQPYSIASLTLVAAETGHLPSDTKSRFLSLFQSIGPKVLRKDFRLQPDEKPVWMFRVGRPLDSGSRIETKG